MVSSHHNYHLHHFRVKHRLTLIHFFFFQAEDGIRDRDMTGVQTCALPISMVALAVAIRRSPLPSTRHSATIVRCPAWMTRPVARSVSPILAALMKLSFRSKLIARATRGTIVRSERPIAESARVLIMPPCTKPDWLRS